MIASPHPRPLSARWRAALRLTAFAAVSAAACRQDGWPAAADAHLSALVVRHRTAAVIRAAHAVSAAAEPAAVAVPIAAATAIAIRRPGWRAGLTPGLTVLTGMAVRRWLSARIGRERPPQSGWLTQPEGFSLPSRHTTLAALTAGACAGAAGAGRPARDAVVAAAAATVGMSRICLGVHWPADVAAGWLFAAGWLELTGALTTRADQAMP